MLKKIWQSFVRWFRNLFGRGTSGSTLSPRGYAKNRIVAHADLPPLDDTDREYLFMQLLEGVAHGWQQPRAIGFFNKIRQRVRKSDWLDWLERFGNNLLEAPVANYELAGRMVQLGQLDCGEIGDLAGEYGARLLDRQAEQIPGDFLPIMEFDALEFDRLDDQIPFVLGDDGSQSSQYRQFGEVPPELLINNDPMPSPPSETREITLEEFSAMLHQDPNLVAELAEQFGVETTDPQAIVNIVVAQMQQQVQQVSGDLTPPTIEPEVPSVPPAVPTPGTQPEVPAAPPEIPAAPPAVPTPTTTPPEVPTAPPAVPTPGAPPEIPATPPAVPTPTTPPEIPFTPSSPPEMPPLPTEVPSTPSSPPEMPPSPPEVPSIPSAPPEISPTTPTMPGISAKQHSAPPPPPFPKLEYKPEDPWQNNPSGDLEPTLPEAANTPDRRGV